MLLFEIFPKNISTYGNEMDNLFWLITAITGLAFVISLFILLYPLVKYRANKVNRATYISGDRKKHFKWVAIAMTCIAMSDFIIMYAELGTWSKMEENPVNPDFHVAITGRQWNWIFTYPGKDGKLYTADDITIDEQNSELHVPMNKNIVIDLKARDVLHSFFVAEIRLKQDAIPGRTIKRWFNMTRECKYDRAGAEICGLLHSQMRNFLVAEPQEKFDAFMNALIEKNQPKP